MHHSLSVFCKNKKLRYATGQLHGSCIKTKASILITYSPYPEYRDISGIVTFAGRQVRYRLSFSFASRCTLSLGEIRKYEHVNDSTDTISSSSSHFLSHMSSPVFFAFAAVFSISRADIYVSAFVNASGYRIKNGSSRKLFDYRANGASVL